MLDTARFLIRAPGELNALAPLLLARGKNLALQVIETSQNPPAARKAWFTLTRRLADFGANHEIIALWEGFDDDFIEWIWSSDEYFWEGLEYVIRSYRTVGLSSTAKQLAQSYLEHPSTPPQGVARLATQLALMELRLRRIEEAFNHFDLVVKVAPKHVMAAYAYYWNAIRCWSVGDISGAERIAANIKFCLGPNPGLFWQKSLRTRGTMLENRLDIHAIAASSEYGHLETLQEEYEKIQEDLKLL